MITNILILVILNYNFVDFDIHHLPLKLGIVNENFELKTRLKKKNLIKQLYYFKSF